PHRQGRPGLDDPGQGGDGHPLPLPRPVPLRRQRPADRHRTPTRAPRHRTLFGGLPPSAALRIITMPDIAEIFQSLEYGPAPEAASLVENWLEAHGRRFEHFIDGRFVAPADGEHFPTMNPAKG